MRIEEIEPGAVGRWVIVTIAGGVHVLSVPADGRATWTTTAVSRGSPPAPVARELVAWGSYDVLNGMREGIAVGESVVLVTEPLGPEGIATAVVSSPVLSITDISGNLQMAGL